MRVRLFSYRLFEPFCFVYFCCFFFVYDSAVNRPSFTHILTGFGFSYRRDSFFDSLSLIKPFESFLSLLWYQKDLWSTLGFYHKHVSPFFFIFNNCHAIQRLQLVIAPAKFFFVIWYGNKKPGWVRPTYNSAVCAYEKKKPKKKNARI